MSQEERLLILQMVAEGKITASEGAELLAGPGGTAGGAVRRRTPAAAAGPAQRAPTTLAFRASPACSRRSWSG